MMKRIVVLLALAATLAGVAAHTAPVSGHAAEEAAPIFVTKIPRGYRRYDHRPTGLELRPVRGK